MKIGQLTFHASHNYGSVLQAYAISRKLQMMGHKTEIINLRPQSQRDAYQIICNNELWYHKAFHYMIYPLLYRRWNEFERFITTVLPISREEFHSTEELCTQNFNYEAYVCGGDQIWNPACQDFETAYYLQFLSKDDKARKISYSPSLGKARFDIATVTQIGEWVKRFDSISVREQSGADLISGASGKPVNVVCDPVLLLNRGEWERIAVKPKRKKPYILVYFLENNHGSRDLTEYLRKTLGYDVVIFNEYIRDFFRPYHKAYSASPEEFVGLFMNASFVYTNSFHGTAFATLFEIPFLTAIAEDQKHAKNNNDSRKIDYLKRIGLEERLYKSGKPEAKTLMSVNYDLARAKIEAFRKESMEYLINALR